MPPTHRQLVLNLYAKLKTSQVDDDRISPHSVVEIRHILRNSRHCSRVFVDADLQSAHGLKDLPAVIPQFIASQLQAQNTADLSRCFGQVSAILDIVCTYLAKSPIRDPFSPILFLWTNPENQRVYSLFAFLTCTMVSRTYTIRELLELRGAQAPQPALEDLKEDPEIGDVVKGRGAAMPPTHQSRRLKKTKEVSASTDSEEILFQGKKHALQDGGDMQWKYRGRTGSEVASSEPLPAPTGLAAQQSEGFQRFFKAVASPTHVRVTAGGRIVPNTRGSASPTAKWDKDRAAQEGKNPAESAKEGQAETVTGTVGQAPPPPMMHPVFPGHPAFFHHMGLPMPLYPMPASLPWTYGIPPGHAPPPNMPHPVSAQSQQSATVASTQGKSEGDGAKKPKPAPIKISPPDQFDQSRPFVFNGHVYPSPVTGGPPHMAPYFPSPYLPPGMIGHPAFPHGRFQPMPHPFSIPVLGSTGPQPASLGSGSQHVHTHSAPKSAASPPITSIKPSEITKRQLDSLRISLRYFEDQLQYNKHQIDEKATKEQAQKIKQNIEQFEVNYKMQLDFEAAHYPKEQSSNTVVMEMPYKTPSRPSSMAGNRTARSQRGSMESTGRPSLRYPKSMERGNRRPFPERNRLAVGINSSKSTNSHQASVALEALEAHILNKLDESDPLKKADAALLRGAALAPPFRPGPNPNFPLPRSECNPSNGLIPAGEAHIGPQSSTVGGYNQGQWQPGSLPQNQRGSWETMQSTSTYFTNDSTPVEGQLAPEQFGQGGLSGAPYLVGRLPPGMSPYTAHGSDYLYSRELTEEEKRARHIYWGGVSSKGLGLPKFDGKDFYPPSPIKTRDSTELTTPVGSRSGPVGCAEADYTLPSRSAKNDPFRPTRDVDNSRSRESGQKFSKAIPIVAPSDVGRDDATKTKAKDSTPAPHASDDTGDLDKALEDCKLSPSGKANVEMANDKKATPRRVLDRSSNKSGHDLWQTMLKKGSTSGNVLPSTVSSTTATGYLPQYFGHAAASLGPAISNPNGSPARGSSNGSKPVETDAVQGPAEKVGENCPPGEAASVDYDATKDLHERMLRDAERRGVIGSDWQ
ncbi:hypothetical protein F4809DRAFT_641723 [Biscogniauxia mediterranea]|nr:hypothetical protein F4809DRAFT_641723 [Biscogniauxia mediterranea]